MRLRSPSSNEKDLPRNGQVLRNESKQRFLYIESIGTMTLRLKPMAYANTHCASRHDLAEDLVIRLIGTEYALYRGSQDIGYA